MITDLDRTGMSTHSSHWGAFSARRGERGLEILPFAGDPSPSPLLYNIPASLNHSARIARPLVRRGWLEDGPGPDARRGSDDYVEVDWDRALDLAAAELRRLGAGADEAAVPTGAGNRVFGGSYGWSSAGRFHHAQSQVHRFLNSAFGGYVKSVNTYSSAAGEVILSYAQGDSGLTRDHPFWPQVAEHTELLIAFGGIPTRNLQVSSGGNSQHVAPGALTAARERGAQLVCISPLRDDMMQELGAEWIAPRPGTDVALMLGMAHHLVTHGLADSAYLKRFTSGYDLFEPYLLGESDGQPKTPTWAEGITGVPAETIADLAERAASSVTLVNTTYSLQRAVNGEQPVWMAVVLAAMLGHGDKAGGGFSYGLGSIGNVGKPMLGVPLPTFPQGRNHLNDFIPVARIADLLLSPGESYTYMGETREYADIRLVYWAGGNPFHHHQDLTRLTRAFARPDTIIVHDSVATATARHADIVFPATVTAERLDIGASGNDPFMHAMHPLSEPYGEARDDYDIFAALAARLDVGATFTEGRNARQWLERMYEPTREALAARGLHAPSFTEFLDDGVMELPLRETPSTLQRFHADPEKNPLRTESGRIQIGSPTIAGYGLPDFPGHPAWLAGGEWLGAPEAAEYPLQLIANQPRDKLHSQLDFGPHSAKGKRGGRAAARMNPADAAANGIVDGDTIRLSSPRGSVFATATISDELAPGIVQLSTGAWYDPAEIEGIGLVCLHGNVNVLTRDVGASALSQGCAGQLSLVRAEKVNGPVPSPQPYDRPWREGVRSSA